VAGCVRARAVCVADAPREFFLFVCVFPGVLNFQSKQKEVNKDKKHYRGCVFLYSWTSNLALPTHATTSFARAFSLAVVSFSLLGECLILSQASARVHGLLRNTPARIHQTRSLVRLGPPRFSLSVLACLSLYMPAPKTHIERLPSPPGGGRQVAAWIHSSHCSSRACGRPRGSGPRRQCAAGPRGTLWWRAGGT
jgi:hypothetical protein